MEAGAADLGAVTERLERIADELEGEPTEDRAAELVREASQLAAEAGRAIESALRGEPRDA